MTAKNETETVIETIDTKSYCEAKSMERGAPVEALSAFYKAMLRAGIMRATREEFESRYQDFLQT